LLLTPCNQILRVLNKDFPMLNAQCPMLMPLQYAISDSIGEATFFSNVDESQSGTDSLHNMNQIGYAPNLNAIKVNCTTIDKISEELQINKIDFLKADVEGHEYFVLKGTEGLLKNGGIDFIQIEFGHAARAAKIYLHDIVELAARHAYEIFVIKSNGFMPLNFTPFTENRYSYANLLLARKAAAEELQKYILKK
jgi:FkbM family methyltransferase